MNKEQASIWVHSTTHCRSGWHLCLTVEGEPIYFRRVGRDRGYTYIFGPEPRGHLTKLVECAPNEGPWLCEACGTFVATESCYFQDFPETE